MMRWLNGFPLQKQQINGKSQYGKFKIFANYNCTIIDVAKVTIGDNCQMAPNVAIYTAGHPVHPVSRNLFQREKIRCGSMERN